MEIEVVCRFRPSERLRITIPTVPMLDWFGGTSYLRPARKVPLRIANRRELPLAKP